MTHSFVFIVNLGELCAVLFSSSGAGRGGVKINYYRIKTTTYNIVFILLEIVYLLVALCLAHLLINSSLNIDCQKRADVENVKYYGPCTSTLHIDLTILV